MPIEHTTYSTSGPIDKQVTPTAILEFRIGGDTPFFCLASKNRLGDNNGKIIIRGGHEYWLQKENSKLIDLFSNNDELTIERKHNSKETLCLDYLNDRSHDHSFSFAARCLTVSHDWISTSRLDFRKPGAGFKSFSFEPQFNNAKDETLRKYNLALTFHVHVDGENEKLIAATWSHTEGINTPANQSTTTFDPSIMWAEYWKNRTTNHQQPFTKITDISTSHRYHYSEKSCSIPFFSKPT